MEEITTLSLEQFCIVYSIETSFVQQLNEHGIIELKHSGTEAFIAFDQLAELEKYMRLHYDLHINMEGIHAIKHLLHQIESLQQEMKRLQGVESSN